MKRNLPSILAFTLIALLGLDCLRAQTQPGITPPVAQTVPSTPTQSRPLPGPGPRPMIAGHPLTQRALASLRAAKLEIARMKGDLDGHRQSALEACDKAMQELEAVMVADNKNMVKRMPPTTPPPPSPSPNPAASNAIPVSPK